MRLGAEPEDDVVAVPPVGEEDWRFITRIGLWGMKLDGTVGAGNAETDINVRFDKLVENMNYGFMPGVEFGKGKWFLAFNGLYSQLEYKDDFARVLQDGQVLEGDVVVKMDLDIADLALSYEAFDIPLGDDGMRLILAPAVGLCYTYMSTQIKLDHRPSRSDDVSWWDPYVGGRMVLKITNRLAWRTDGSFGGWGVGCNSTWAVQTMLDWRFARRRELNVGYRALHQNYDDDLKWDMTMRGPWIGASTYC